MNDEQAENGGTLEEIYFNGFKLGVGAGDVVVVLQRNGEDFAVANLSYTVAKTLGIGLNELVADLEKQSGREIMTAQEIVKALNREEAQA